MRQLAGRLQGRRRTGVAVVAGAGLIVLLAGLLAGQAATSVTAIQPIRPGVAAAHRDAHIRAGHAGQTGPHLPGAGRDQAGPLALIASGPVDGDPGRGDAAGATGHATGHITPGPDSDSGGGVWPDSSSPVRNAPSNATAGPAIPPVFSLPGWTVRKVNLTVSGRLRYYLVARPDNVSAGRLPVLMVLPGRNMTPSTVARASGFLAMVGQAVMVFPAGFANSWNAGYCCGVAHLAGVNDVAFLETVVRSVLATQPGTSASAVYIAGFSNGGRMALDMACADPGAFAGVAAVEAVAVSTCQRTSPVPLLDIASTADPLLTIGLRSRPKHIAGHTEITVQALIDHWRAIERCGTETVRTHYPIMAYTLWPRCASGTRVALAVYNGGRHAWPRGGPGTPPAQAVIWSFFHGIDPPAPPRTLS